MTHNDKIKIAKDIVAKIEWDINDRSGMDLGSFDEGIQEEIRETWLKLVMKALGE